MITEYKVSEKYGNYVINILVKMDSTEAEISVVGIEVEEGVFDILEGGEKVIATFPIDKGTESPMVVKAAFAAWLEKNGTSILDAAILGEPAPVVEVVEEKPKVAAKPRAKAKPKKKTIEQIVEELPADSDGIEKD